MQVSTTKQRNNLNWAARMAVLRLILECGGLGPIFILDYMTLTTLFYNHKIRDFMILQSLLQNYRT